MIKNYTNNTMVQFFFIFSISTLLSFLSVFCMNVVVFAEVDITSSGENSPVSAVDLPKEINLFNNNIYVTNNGSNIVINNATNTSVDSVPFESRFNSSSNLEISEEDIETIIISGLDKNRQIIENHTTTTSNSITFQFSAELNGKLLEQNILFDCSLDNSSSTPCDQGFISYSDLEIRDEPYVFKVNAFTRNGTIIDTTPANFSWTIEKRYSNNDKSPNSNESATIKNLKFCYNSQFGSLGTGDGQFNRPHDIVFDSKGFLYVNDRELNNFQKFSPDGKFISKFGEEGDKLGQYSSPYSMAIDSNDHIYVLDRGNDRIVKVDTEGNVLGALYSFNGPWITNNNDISEKKGDNGFSSPEAMTLDKEGNFYLTDTGNDRVIKFDKNFKFVSQFGIEGTAPGQFDHPHGIGIDSDGNIFINELTNARIQKFTNNGKFIKQWGSEGKGPGQFTLEVEHLKVDKNDRIFITDGADNPRVQVFDNDGHFLTQFGKVGSGNGEFNKPEHVAFNEKDDKGTVYVVDRGNARIQTFIPCNE